MASWDEAPLPRDPIVLIATTLGDRIPDDHPVRLFHDILASLDGSGWENHYCQVAGQPAIPPMIVGGAILYGLSQGIRSSRRLEWACKNAVDFLWLVEGRPIDPSTFCHFRTRFERELKDLFRQIGHLAMNLGLVRLNDVSLDGTRVLANSSRHATATAKTLAEREAVLNQPMEAMFARIQQQDGQQRDLFGDHDSPNTLPAELAARMPTERGRKTHARRGWTAETPNAVIKQVMGVRRFLLRGLDKVRIEWRWACTAFNLQKMVRFVAAVRTEVALIQG